MYQLRRCRTGPSFRLKMFCLRSMTGKEWRIICQTGRKTNCLRGNSFGECCTDSIQIEWRAWFRKQRQPECPNRPTFKINSGDCSWSLKSSTSSSNMTMCQVSYNYIFQTFGKWPYLNIAKKGRGSSSIIFSQVGEARRDKRRKISSDNQSQMRFEQYQFTTQNNGMKMNIQNPRKNSFLEEMDDE